MFGMGPLEVLLMLVISGGGTSTDLASLLPAPTYFKSRDINISVEKAIELAGKDPIDGKTQIAQLVALRYLGDESVKLKGSPDYAQHRQMLEQIAAGKKAQDAQGFAKEYAERVLRRLDGAQPIMEAKTALRDEAFRWFPADATLVGAVDTRTASGDGPAKSISADMLKMFPDEILKTVFGVVEKMGNVRIDRVAFAYVEDVKDASNAQVFVRVTGKANSRWLVDAFKELNTEVKTSKGPRDETITKLKPANDDAPGIMFIGDSELVVAGYTKQKANHDELLAKVLELRSGKQQPGGQSLLKTELAKVPAKACGLIVGSLPAEAFRGAPFPMPVTINGHLLRTQNALDVNLTTSMASEDDAKQLVQQVSKFRQQGIDALKKAQGLPIPGLKIEPMIQMLESMQVEAQGSTAKVRMLMPDDMLGGGAMFFGARVAPVPPPPAKEEQK
jgi:hypothetical protein